MSELLKSRFRTLLEKQGIYREKQSYLEKCPFHLPLEKTASFSIHTERCVFHCFGCGVSGGVKDFALAVGEPWGAIRYSSYERARFAAQARRRQAEAQAQAILQRCKDERADTLWAAWGEATMGASAAAELLDLFFRRPDLAEKFPCLVSITERDYSEALFQKMMLEARFAGDI